MRKICSNLSDVLWDPEHARRLGCTCCLSCIQIVGTLLQPVGSCPLLRLYQPPANVIMDSVRARSPCRFRWWHDTWSLQMWIEIRWQRTCVPCHLSTADANQRSHTPTQNRHGKKRRFLWQKNTCIWFPPAISHWM